jgi:hypothetical protein
MVNGGGGGADDADVFYHHLFSDYCDDAVFHLLLKKIERKRKRRRRMKSVQMCWKSNHRQYFHLQKMMAAAKVMNVAGVCDADASSCYASS